MTLVDVGSPAVLFSTRDKKFVSGLSRTEIQNITNNYYVSGGGVVPWICSLYGSKYLAVGVGRMFRLIKTVSNSGKNIWLDDYGNLWMLSVTGWLSRWDAGYWKEYEETSQGYTWHVTNDYEGRFQAGDDMIYIKAGSSIKGYTWTERNKNPPHVQKEWESSVSGAIGDFQWNKADNRLVVPVWDRFFNEIKSSVLIDGDSGKIEKSRNLGFNSWAVAKDKEGRYWFLEADGKRIIVCDPDDLTPVDITINGTTYHGTFEVPFLSRPYDISENSKFDILVTDRCGHYAAFFSADDDYSNMIRVSLDVNSAWVAPMGENGFFFLTSTTEDNCVYESRTFYLMNPDSQRLLPVTMPTGRAIGGGDPGLGRWKTWGRSWKPKVSAIYDYLYTPPTEES